jgi:hypothetical protein
MDQSRPGQQGQVVETQPPHQARGRAYPRRTRRLAQIPDVQRQARRVKKKRRNYVRTCHRMHASAGRAFFSARRKSPLPQYYSQFPNPKARIRGGLVSDKPCQLNRSMQHHLISRSDDTSSRLPLGNRSVRLYSIKTETGQCSVCINALERI